MFYNSIFHSFDVLPLDLMWCRLGQQVSESVMDIVAGIAHIPEILPTFVQFNFPFSIEANGETINAPAREVKKQLS
jgi:hypothetical protein